MANELFKAMLASPLPDDLTDELISKCVTFPVLASPKLDGVRATNQHGKLLSRTQKLIPNKHTQSLFGRRELKDIDGELIVGDPTADDVFVNTSGPLMREEFAPDVNYFVFDKYGDKGFTDRLRAAEETIKGMPNVVLVPHELVYDAAHLLRVEKVFLSKGYEGLMLRSVNGRYKQGRSTVNEGLLVKLKRFKDGEAIIIGFEEERQNTNAKTLTSNGKAKRSHHKAGKIGKDTLGALVVRDLVTDVEFKVYGFTDAVAKEIWTHQSAYLNKIAKYRYFPKGIKNKPRHPTYQGLRDPRDM